MTLAFHHSACRRALFVASLFLALTMAPLAGAVNVNRLLTQALHRIWQTQQGLPQATLYRIRQTSDGYLWIASQTGLVRFDGVHFTTLDDLDHAVSLRDVWIHDVLEDNQHNLWIATEGQGLIRWRAGGSVKQFRRADGLPSDTIHSLLFDSRGTLWICTPDGLALFDHDKLTTLPLPIHSPQTACESPDGSVYVGGAANALCVFAAHATTPTVLPLPSLPATTSILSLLADPDGTLWIGTPDGLIHRDTSGAERVLTTKDKLPGNVIYCLERGDDQTVWAGTDNGFARIRGGAVDDRFQSKDGLSQSTVYTLCEDHELSLWAGTKHGLDQFTDRRTVPFTVTEGLPSNDTGPVLEGHRGSVWIGSIGAGLTRYDRRRGFQTLTTAHDLASDTIRALAASSNGDTWVGTDKGLTQLRWGHAPHTYTTGDGLPSDDIRCLTTDAKNTLWIGTDKGPAVLRAGVVTRLPGDQPVHALATLHDGAVLASIGNGTLSTLSPGTPGERAGVTGPASNDSPTKIDCIYEDPDHHLWLGTAGRGLSLLRNDGRLTTFTVRDGLYDDEIYGIVADDQDNLWFACSKGIFSVSRRDLLASADGSRAALTANPFSPTDALRTIECKSDVQPAATRSRDGKLWFSTIHGAIAIDPEHLSRRRAAPPVAIESVVVNGQAQPPATADAMNLPPGLNNLEFHYTALSYLSPTRTVFRYQLEGFDKGWIDAGSRREAFYTNLAPGQYRFRVVARIVDGVSAEAPAVALQLQPHFYQRRIFIPLCVLLAASIAYFIYWRRVRFIRANAQAVLNERSRIARELHDTLMQGFAGVTMELQALASRLPGDSERKVELNEIIRDAGVCLREARQSVAGLRTNVRLDTSTLATALTQAARQVTQDKPVRLRLSLRPPANQLPPEIEYNLLRIAQEALTNAVKHAACRAIDLTLSTTEDMLHLAIADDGDGITAAANPGHYGLVGMKERAAQIRATLDVESQPGSGTTIRVSLPLASSHRHPLSEPTRPLPEQLPT